MVRVTAGGATAPFPTGSGSKTGPLSGGAKLAKNGDNAGSKKQEKPIRKKPGTRTNPDGSKKSPFDQYDQIAEAQKRKPSAIESIKKSKQGVDNFLRSLRGNATSFDAD